MNSVGVAIADGIANVTLERGKVNALDEDLIDELSSVFAELADDPSVRAVVLSGQGSFFSFGFDIPQFLDYPKHRFAGFLSKFTDLYTDLFEFPKPLIAALNGHAIAGGCMLALACDVRLMSRGAGKISLNEIAFGSTVFAGSVEMLRFVVGDGNAQRVLYSGEMYTAEQAARIGLIDEVVTAEKLDAAGRSAAEKLATRAAPAFKSIKHLLRHQFAERMREREPASIEEFVEIWYSPQTWRNLQQIRIRS